MNGLKPDPPHVNDWDMYRIRALRRAVRLTEDNLKEVMEAMAGCEFDAKDVSMTPASIRWSPRNQLNAERTALVGEWIVREPDVEMPGCYNFFAMSDENFKRRYCSYEK